MQQPRYLNWNNADEVTAFVKKYKLPPITWEEFGRVIMGVMTFRGPLRDKININLEHYRLNPKEDLSKKLNSASLALAESQDAVIFGDVEPEAVPDLLKKFESRLAGLTK